MDHYSNQTKKVEPNASQSCCRNRQHKNRGWATRQISFVVLSLAFVLFGTSTLQAQFGPCANNNNSQPPLGPPLPPANTMLINSQTVINMPGEDFCIGNMQPPAPQTIDGCGSFTFTNIPVGTATCNTQICYTPKQGCGNAIGNVCVWEDQGAWVQLGSPTAATGEICIEIQPGVTQYTTTVCRPGDGPISIQDVYIIQCCIADAGTVAVTPTTVCPGGTVTASTTGNQTSNLYTQVFLLDLNNNGTIDAINSTGIFNVPLNTPCGSTHTVCSYNYQTAGTAPPNPANISDIDCVANCCDLDCTTFTVDATTPPSIICPADITTAACQTQTAVNMAFATWLLTATGSGGCNGTVTNNSTGAPPACGGSRTVTFTYNSSCAPTMTTCQATFTVPAAPTVSLTCPVNTTEAACQTQTAINSAFATWLATASASGGCNGVLTNNSTGAPPACGGSTTVIFTYTSTCAPLTTTCQATFTVDAPPTVSLTCPVNTTTVACQTQAAVNSAFATWLATASASGGCNGVLTNNNTGAPSACGGSTTVTFTYTSTCAPLTTTCQATFTVASSPVVLTCPTNTTTPACQTQAAVNSAFAIWLATASGSGGCNGVLTNNNTGAPPACGGSTTVIFTYTSSCAPLTTTCQATFTVDAPTTVVLTCPMNTTVGACQTQAAVNAQFATWLATASGTGGCNGVLDCNDASGPSFHDCAAPSACGGSTTVEFTYTSTCAPFTTTCTATFTVAAPAMVVLTCPTNATTPACQTQAAVNSAFATWLATASASGGCNGVLTNNNTGAPSACGGSTTVTFTYTSTCAPFTTTCTATFTVAAPAMVVLTCPINTTVGACQTQAAINGQFNAWLASASAIGGCNGVLTNNNTGAPSACGGSTTVTFTYTSTCAPFTTTCTATFTVAAPAMVVLTCPINTTVGACQTQAAINGQFNAWLASASAIGGCNGVLTNNNTGAPSACGGSTTVTFTYTSTCAPFTTTCTATFTVAAPAMVVLTCPINTTVGACQTQAAINAQFNAWLASASASGGCNGVLTNNNTGAPSACGGSTTVTFTYTSTCAPFTTTCTATFTVAAPAMVVLTCPTNTTTPACQTQAAVNSAFATWLATASASGGCNGVLTNNNTGAPSACGGSTTVIFTYTSTCAPFTTTCTATFTVTAPPIVMLTCPVNTTTAACQTQAAVNAAFATWLATASASGGCNGVLTNNNTGAPSACGGSTTVIFTYTSTCAPFTTTCTAIFTVAAPAMVVLTCPTSTTTAACQTQAAVNSAFATWLATASASGGCNGVLTNNSTGAPSACGGSTTVTFTYSSSCAPTTTTCQATFTVAAPPMVVLTCPVNTTTAACQTQAAVNAAFATWLATTSGTGGCNGVLTNNNTGAPSACGGSTTVIFTYTSTCAPFTNTCTATFTVAAPPMVVLTCPQNATVAACSTQVQVNAAFTAWLATASASGGCNGVLTNNNTGAPSACGGSTTVIFTYTSTCAPFTTTCTATFTVAAPPMVVLTCPQNATVAACSTQVQVNAAFTAWLATASASGGCNGVLTNNNTGAPSACGGSTTVIFTYTSTCAPFTTTCTATFTVTAPPIVMLTCPINTTVGACQTQAAINAQFNAWLATASASGGCNGVLTNNGTGAPSACGGSTTVTFTYTSTCAPLTTTCTATFTVTAPPIVMLTCPVNTTTAACQTQAAVNAEFATWLATASASGGCNGVLTNNTTGAPSACGGSTTVTFTYTSTCAPLTTTCTATFTVAAPAMVVLTCPTSTTAAACQTQAAVNAAFATWLATASASGGCNGVLTNNSTGAPSACGGSTTVTFTYTSTCAPLTTTCTATFTVAAPAMVVLTCPMNTTAAACQTQAAVNAAFATWLATASASGGCNGVLTNNSTGAPSACGGSTTVTFTYTSTCAPLTTTCTATFTVANPPTVMLTCPAPLTVGACLTQAQLNTAYANWLASVSASGGCNGVLTNNNAGTPTICNLNGVTRTVTWTYTSTCAPFTTTCTSTFTVAPYPTFTVPANGAATVACPANATPPVLPLVLDGCGKTLTPTGPVVTNNPNPLTCEGTRTYTYTYTDCAGQVRQWSFVYTIERNNFTVPPNGSATVNCPDQTDQAPIPPVVLSDCGEVLTPVLTMVGPKPGCEGVRQYTFTYTDCEGNTNNWIFTYNVVYLNFTVPPSETYNLECPFQAYVPTPPAVLDNCGKITNRYGPVVTVNDNNFGCEGERVYTWTYEDCSGNTRIWSVTFKFLYSDVFWTMPDKVNEVTCIDHAVEPVPPTLYNVCGNEISVELVGVEEELTPLGCSGWRVYYFTYSDCGGHKLDWKFTYYINDNVSPVGTVPNVDVTNLTCIEDVPCPDDHDFSGLIQEIIEEGNFYDNCKEPIVTLDSWSDAWSCSDEDGDGVYTFGRTFYFRIEDRCGNVYPELVPVTYSGVCQPLGNFSMAEWGTEGGAPANTTLGTSSDLDLIASLLSSGGSLKIGGSNRSISVDNAQCVMNMLPGMGGVEVLANCQQNNCNGCNPMGITGLKNGLAANAIALELNIRYGIYFNDIDNRIIARSTPLDCIDLHPCIINCDGNGICHLRIFDALGEEYAFPYTVGGLQDLVNLYLNGALDLSGGLSVIYGTALNQSLMILNSYSNEQSVANLCNGNAAVIWDTPDPDDIEGLEGSEKTIKTFTVSPNPAQDKVRLKLPELNETENVSLIIFNNLGQQVMVKVYDQVKQINDVIYINGLPKGMYTVELIIGKERQSQRLFIMD